MTDPKAVTKVADGWVWDQVKSLDYLHAAYVLGVPVGWLKEKVPAGEVDHSRMGRHVVFTPENIAANRRRFSRPATDPGEATTDSEAYRMQLRAALARNAA
jgi:hypothetical protein